MSDIRLLPPEIFFSISDCCSYRSRIGTDFPDVTRVDRYSALSELAGRGGQDRASVTEMQFPEPDGLRGIR
jgi:hypothetical protein